MDVSDWVYSQPAKATSGIVCLSCLGHENFFLLNPTYDISFLFLITFSPATYSTITGHPTPMKNFLLQWFGHIMVAAFAVGRPGIFNAVFTDGFTCSSRLAVLCFVWMYS
jgi:hypothetical protein